MVSMGPFHQGEPELRMIEEQKFQYLGQLLDRTGLSLSDLFTAIAPLKVAARDCYCETIAFDPHDHLEILVVDGCFIIELFRKVAKLVKFKPNDPIAFMSWIFPALLRDLPQLENQMPFFVKT